MSNRPSTQKCSVVFFNSIIIFFSDNRKQDDTTEFSHHLWTESLAEAKKLRQRVCGPEFCSRGGQRSHHQRAPKDDQYIWYAISGEPLLLHTSGWSLLRTGINQIMFRPETDPSLAWLCNRLCITDWSRLECKHQFYGFWEGLSSDSPYNIK